MIVLKIRHLIDSTYEVVEHGEFDPVESNYYKYTDPAIIFKGYLLECKAYIELYEAGRIILS